MMEEFSEVKILNVFEECWKELLKDYSTSRLDNIYCTEGDIRLHLAHKLLGKLHLPICVHAEYPIPLQVEDFVDTLFWGRPIRKRKKGKGLVADIAILNVDDIFPVIAAEIKYVPFLLNLHQIMDVILGKTSEDAKGMKKNLQREIGRLETWEKSGPTNHVIQSCMKNVGKTIQLVKDFKQKQDWSLHAYLCIIDEFYPDLEARLEKEIKEYDPPGQFKLRVEHFSIRKWLQEQMKNL